MRPWVLIVMWVAGCYSPSVRDCVVACESPADCIGGQVCAGGWCTTPDHACTAATTPDSAAVTHDAPVDGSTLCELGCPNGSCDDGVCVIDCSAPDACPTDVTCPPNVPCRVYCGDRACRGKVLCGLSSSCEVLCTGTSACAGEVHCNTRPCDVFCTGDGSCARRIKCKEACACDVTCSGEDACGETQECPLIDACRLGRGCSSALPGCDRCM